MGCSGDSGSSGGADAGGLDAGAIGLCPQADSPACARAADCADDFAKLSNCGGCHPYNYALCTQAACSMPETLMTSDLHVVSFQVGALQPELKSFAGTVIAAVTAGGAPVACDDVYAKRVDLSSPCYNVLDSRGFAGIAQAGDTYVMSFSRFASGQRSLFIINGYSLENSGGDPIGVSCTSFDVGGPGVGRTNIEGDPMRRIQ